MKRRYLWLPLLILAFILAQTLPALCENSDTPYSGTVLVFQAPRDAELTSSESAADSYFQTLCCPGLNETIMSGAFPSAEAAEKKLVSLFGEAAASGSVNDALDAVARSLEAVRSARRALEDGMTPDVVLTDAEAALEALGELNGKRIREDLVQTIFSRFCVGK